MPAVALKIMQMEILGRNRSLDRGQNIDLYEEKMTPITLLTSNLHHSVLLCAGPFVINVVTISAAVKAKHVHFALSQDRT